MAMTRHATRCIAGCLVVALGLTAACGGEDADDAVEGAMTVAEDGTASTTPAVRSSVAPTAPPSVAESAPVSEPHPDGRIAFGRIMPGHEQTDQLMALYAIDPDGTDEIQLTDGNSYGPAWSPDGTRLAFTLVADDGSSQIATVAADGTDLQMLTSGPGVHETPSWSPDGTWIAYGYSPNLPGTPACTHRALPDRRRRVEPDVDRRP